MRITEWRGWLTVKGERKGPARVEFEYEIAVVEAEAMLTMVCETCVVEKTRHCVPYAGMNWEVDV